MKNLSLKEKKAIIDHFYNNIENDQFIFEITIKRLDLDEKTIYGKSRINFLKDFQDYILKNGKDEKIKYIYPSIAYNM